MKKKGRVAPRHEDYGKRAWRLREEGLELPSLLQRNAFHGWKECLLRLKGGIPLGGKVLSERGVEGISTTWRRYLNKSKIVDLNSIFLFLPTPHPKSSETPINAGKSVLKHPTQQRWRVSIAWVGRWLKRKKVGRRFDYSRNNDYLCNTNLLDLWRKFWQLY